jgi:hypothetical protein
MLFYTTECSKSILGRFVILLKILSKLKEYPLKTQQNEKVDSKIISPHCCKILTGASSN